MKKAVLILSLIFMVLVLIQSVLVGFGGVMFADKTLNVGALLGRIAAILFGVGAAFILAVPLVSLGAYVLICLLGIAGGLATGYYDLVLWGALAAGLAAMSYFAGRETGVTRVEEERVRQVSQF